MATAGDPEDLVPAHRAAEVALCSPRTLRRWATLGRIREFRRPFRSARYYSEAECRALRPTAAG